VREVLDGRARDAVMAGRRADRGYVFPSPADPTKPMDRWYASRLLRRAERRARVPKLGSLWHAYRRKWGTERKHLPVQDVARAGGWKDAHTLATIYQQADDATVLRAVTEPKVLREA
jgi:hypothetical protein